MKTKHYSKKVQDLLAKMPDGKTERHYFVPDSGHSWTFSLTDARKWATETARRFGGQAVPVLFRDVTLSPWQVASDHVAVEDDQR